MKPSRQSAQISHPDYLSPPVRSVRGFTAARTGEKVGIPHCIPRQDRRMEINPSQSIQHVDALRELYGASYAPSAAQLASTLPDIGDGLAAQCAALHRDPTPHAAETLAANLDGARRAVLRLRESLQREGGGDGR